MTEPREGGAPTARPVQDFHPSAMQPGAPSRAPLPRRDLALLAVGVLCTLSICAWLLRYSRYGVDFTDESFYLVWIANPFLYEWSVYLFGFFYHPLFGLLRGDVAALRQANLLVSFGLSSMLVWVLLRKHGPGMPASVRAVLAGSVACAGFLIADTWLPTPSYNSLAQQGLLVAAAGLVLAEREPSRQSLLGWLLVAAGGWLAFSGKPSSAAALAVVAPLYVAAAGKMNLRLLALAGAVAAGLLLATAFAIDGSVQRFAARLSTGVEYLGYMQGGYSAGDVLRWDGFSLPAAERVALVVLALGASFGALCLQGGARAWAVGAVVCGLLAGGTLVLSLDVPVRGAALGPYKDLLLLAVPLAAVVAVVLAPAHLARPRRAELALALLLAILPHVYAFGTNGNYWQAAGAAGVFWVAAGLVLLLPALAPGGGLALLPLALATQLVTAAVMFDAMQDPYRQPEPLRHNRMAVQFGSPSSNLLLSDDYAAYLESVRKAAGLAGFQPGTPVIDLSGQSPGILYALGARNIGQAWMIGGYPGSGPLAAASLRHVPCEEIGRAWLLAEPGGPRRLSGAVLQASGLSVERDYSPAGSWHTARGAGGYANPRLQVLMKPLRADAEAACRQARQAPAPAGGR